MTLKLDKVNRGPHLSTLVASSISREIAQGRLNPGDQLPTEQALAQTFGVSRNVVREAIARLRSEGRIWSQQGRGAFVADVPNTTVLTIDYDALQQADAFRSLFELRGIIEVQVAALAARRRSEADLDAMRNAQAMMAEAPYGSVTWLKADLEFHRTVAAATQNAYTVQFLVFVSERVRDSILAAGNQQRSDDMAGATLGEHERILAAIEAGDAEAAQRAMQQHLANAAQRVGGAQAEPDP
ncbi:FadR/GntR family transcriptional regulator [Pararhizobium sp.]|uniref:FadR/GntR family transcriptional regulator n=1 Tax=Pararhizobium sp. TaxID=1977563 RepID=UPI00271B24B5|nr:FadR/GntR family transcriptional regulator [Pararhizobium sp.]MDO9418110.1 FadR/GntR family transcriptional regulator [Pararhizobium sp.]